VTVQEASTEARRYSMVIEWSDEDGLYIATIPELPGCRTHGKTQVEAVEMGRDAIAEWLDANRAWERPIPAPHLFADRVREEDAAAVARQQVGDTATVRIALT